MLIVIRHLKQFFLSEPHLLTPGYINDFVCDLNLSKKQVEIFSVKLKLWNLLRQDREMFFLWLHGASILKYFIIQIMNLI